VNLWSPEDIQKSFKNSTVRKRQKLETIQMLINNKIEKYVLVWSHNGTLYNHKNEQTPPTFSDMDQSRKHKAEKEK